MMDLHDALKKHFGFSHFLDGQEDIIRAVLNGRDSLVIMPTGSGKSVCYQLPALVLEGTALVISPLIALMKDQVDALEARGIPATCLNSSLDAETIRDRMKAIRAGRIKMVYAAPERLHNEGFRRMLQAITVSMIAVDEAHCISQWGHDFRPDYLRIRDLVDAFPQARLMALTATATPAVKDDILAQLGLGEGSRAEPDVQVLGFERPNLELHVRRVNSHAEKHGAVLNIIQQWQTGIIYCATRKQVEKVGARLKEANGSVVEYHAGLTDRQREQAQDRFITGKADVAVATNAFGMGIDRDDLRFVIHWDIPGSIEAYYQEIGRAGRDGKDAHCELLYSYADVRTQEFFLEGANPSPDLVLKTYKAVRRRCSHGPATHTGAEWVEIISDGANPMAVNTSLYLLDRAGLLQRSVEPGTRTFTYDITHEDPAAGLAGIVEGLADKALHDRQKLEAMIRYANAATCRHRGLLAYFGEVLPDAACTMCDNCTGTADGARPPENEDEWVLIQKVLSGAARMKGRFGKARVAQMLVGSKARAVLEAGLDRLPTYGALKGTKEQDVKILLDELTRDGCLAVSDGDYPTLGITEKGLEAVQKETAPEIRWPSMSSGKKTKGSSAGPVSEEPADPELFEKLKTWRNREARGRPVYLVMTDKTLRALAAAKPTGFEDLPHIWGLGPSKIKNYGKDVLTIISDHV